MVTLLTSLQQKDNDDGFGKSAAVHAEYVKFLAGEAASRDLAMGLKNALDLIPDVVDVVQFAVNEQCHEFGECDAYKPFTEAGKAVFNIEYNGQCDAVDGVVMTTVTKELDLSQLGGQCNAGGANPPTPTETKKETAPSATEKATQPAVTKTPVTTQPPAVQPVKSATPSSSTTGPPKATPSSTVPADGEDEDEGEDEEENGEQNENEDEDDDDAEEEMPRPHYRHKYHGGWHNSIRARDEE
jgi:hypothetical protein